MRTLGNVLWHFPFFGFVTALLTFLCGLILMILVIPAPIGRGLVEHAKFLLAPFERSMVKRSLVEDVDTSSALHTYAKVIGILYLPLGLILVVLNVIQVVGMLISIIGIPVALVVVKSLRLYLNPVGMKCVPRAVAEELERRAAQKALDDHGLS